MVRFKSAWKGYDKKQVDEYLHKTNSFQESKIKELEECVERLKGENDYLYAKNAEYRRNEERVSSAILKAMEVKNTLEREMRGKITQEEDRLQIFKTKWIAYTRGINKSNADRVVNDIQNYIETFRREFIHKANRELDLSRATTEEPVAERSYLSESRRVQAILQEGKEEKMSAASLAESDQREDDAHQTFFEE